MAPRQGPHLPASASGFQSSQHAAEPDGAELHRAHGARPNVPARDEPYPARIPGAGPADTLHRRPGVVAGDAAALPFPLRFGHPAEACAERKPLRLSGSARVCARCWHVGRCLTVLGPGCVATAPGLFSASFARVQVHDLSPGPRRIAKPRDVGKPDSTVLLQPGRLPRQPSFGRTKNVRAVSRARRTAIRAPPLESLAVSGGLSEARTDARRYALCNANHAQNRVPGRAAHALHRVRARVLDNRNSRGFARAADCRRLQARTTSEPHPVPAHVGRVARGACPLAHNRESPIKAALKTAGSLPRFSTASTISWPASTVSNCSSVPNANGENNPAGTQSSICGSPDAATCKRSKHSLCCATRKRSGLNTRCATTAIRPIRPGSTISDAMPIT